MGRSDTPILNNFTVYVTKARIRKKTHTHIPKKKKRKRREEARIRIYNKTMSKKYMFFKK